MPAGQVLFACPVQLFRGVEGVQTFVGVAGCAVVDHDACRLLQCYSSAKEIYTSIDVDRCEDLEVVQEQDGGFVHFTDGAAVSWSFRLKTAADGSALLRHLPTGKCRSHPAPVVPPVAPAECAPPCPPERAPEPLTSNDVVRALALTQMQQQPLQLAAIHQRLAEISEKVDRLDLASQCGAFQQIITEFDKNNRTFYTTAHRDEKDIFQLTAELSRERGEHSVTQQELQIAQRELRLEVDLKLGYQAKVRKWKNRFREAESRHREAEEELRSALQNEIDGLGASLAQERGRLRQAETEHALGLDDAYQRGLLEGKGAAIQNAVESGGQIQAHGSESAFALLELKAKLTKQEEDMVAWKKEHLEETVGLQERLIREKERVKVLEAQLKDAQRHMGKLIQDLAERDQQMEEAKGEAEATILRLQERLVNMGEGHWASAAERAKTELRHHQQALERCQAESTERKDRHDDERRNLAKQRDRLSEELAELRALQFRHDSELNLLQVRLVAQKEAVGESERRLGDALAEVQRARQERDEARLERDETLQKLPTAGVDHPDRSTIFPLVKEIMSNIYYELAEQFTEGGVYEGAAINAILLRTIKEQTLRLQGQG
eukprot:GGOE01019313.1.p1 GENE.GGOE01019313.1~~GGOE01019313.1.p1  ORF type:complete len:608 (+),score=174.57 GGOE01019313.1:90-1913(+)